MVGDRPDWNELRSVAHESGQALDAHASTPKLVFGTAGLTVDLLGREASVRAVPASCGEIHVRVDHDQAVRSELGLMRPERCDSEARVRDAEQHERASRFAVDLPDHSRKVVEIHRAPPVEMAEVSEPALCVSVLRVAATDERVPEAPGERAHLLAVSPAAARGDYAFGVERGVNGDDRAAGCDGSCRELGTCRTSSYRDGEGGDPACQQDRRARNDPCRHSSPFRIVKRRELVLALPAMSLAVTIRS